MSSKSSGPLTGLVAPVLLVSAVLGPRLVGAVRLVDVLVLALVPALVVVRLRQAFSPVLDGFERMALAFVAWASVATLIGLATGTLGFGGWAALTVARLLELVIVYAACRTWRPHAGVIEGVSLGLVAGLALFGAWEIAVGLIVDGEPYVRAFNEGYFAGESTHVAGALAVLAPVAMRRRPGSGAAVAVAAALASGSRTGIVATVVATAREFWMSRRRVAVFVVVAGVLVAAAIAPATFRGRFASALESHVYRGPHVDRFEAWRVAVAEAPPWGVGLGARPSSVYESHYAWSYGETGLPGLVFSIAALGALLLAPTSRGEEEWRTRSGIGIALLVMGFAANVWLIARVAIPAAVLLATFAPRENASREPISGEGTAEG